MIGTSIGAINGAIIAGNPTETRMEKLLEFWAGLASKRARISGTDSLRGGELVIKAQVPLAEVTYYQTELKAMTGGQGRYAIEFSHYDPVPPQVQKQLVDAYKPKPEEE